ncbi:MAG: hypothetical protein IKC09_03360 [Oscillospiraceae bacterium]|nr:hypothetical protein [Oscillospiraceae bacterium]
MLSRAIPTPVKPPFGTLITTGSVGAGFLPGLIVVAAIVAVIAYLINKTNKSLAAEYALKK